MAVRSRGGLQAPWRVWRFRNLVFQFAQKEIKLKYARSFFGVLWSLMNPAATMLVYVIVFGIILRVNPPPAANGRQSYVLFVFCALVPWNFFTGVVRGSMLWLVTASPLMHKVYFPPETPVLAGSLTVAFQTLMESIVLILALIVVGNLSWVSLMVIPLFACLFLFTLGLALLVSVAYVYFRDVGWFVEIGTTLIFFLTPVFYPIEIVPEEIWGILPLRDLVLLNPVTQFVLSWRAVLYGLDMPDAINLVALFAVSVGIYAAGSMIFARFADHITEEL